MAAVIRAIFVTPGIAIARLGGSTTPQHAYDWVESNQPRDDAETTIAPAWTLVVQTDGTVDAFMPPSVTFRDGDLIRPVAPFFEIWARLGEPGSAAATWQDQPLTPALLEAHGTSLSSLRLSVIARNLKAARRTGNPQHAFGNWTPVAVLGNEHSRMPILGASPPDAAVPMIPSNRSIPLGFVQILRSRPQPTDQPWSNALSVETIRFRFTPGTGQFYGPPDAATAQPSLGRPERAVPAANAFLNANAGWRGESTGPFVVPGDTYDLIDQSSDANTQGPSLGVVDDTCEVHFSVSLRLADATDLRTRAVAFVAPPDFAPDRRPFLSLADEFNDRDGDAALRNQALNGADLDRWVEDLFERIYETVSLFNVDSYRRGRAATVPQALRRPTDLDNGLRAQPERAMGGLDALRNPLYRLPSPSPNDLLPLSQHARMRHRALSDLQNLISLLALTPARNRLRDIVRAPFEAQAFENGNATSMRMPPFMRQSNALPLTLASWQYALLMRWSEAVRTAAASGALESLPEAPPARVLSPSAAARRAAVLTQVDAAPEQ